MRGLFDGWHIVILLILVIALFGAKRLPDAARSLGRSARIFKSEVDEMKKESKSSASQATVQGETITPGEGSVHPSTAPQASSPVSENPPRTDNPSGAA